MAVKLSITAVKTAHY